MRIDPAKLATFVDRESITDNTKATVVDVQLEQSNFGAQHNATLRFENGSVGKVRLNTTSLRELIEKYGEETEMWKGKSVTLRWTETQVGKRMQETLVVS